MKVSIVFESGYGHTARVARHVADGAASVAGTEVELVEVDGEGEVDLDALGASDAIIFGSPTYNGALGWKLKRFFESTTGPVWSELKWRGKVAAGFTNSGAVSGDKLGTLVSLALFAAQHGMVWVNLDLLPGHGGKDELNRLGGWLGVMTQSDDAPPEQTPPAGDLRTAEHLGRRVAETAAKLRS
ncbi:flavodoxin family protein [Novosphingobium mangrovi (ex Hu et al. 2023)]|uniref:Flavodoxin family protein n=1 Tax=Novosphingobium mangrovi (ex Hu et al. 2023) TaxID=2930094 RepID=A0ABT0AG04_9SPHN|nr:flavodoxin family protein [Novosphingobium mangrovi (ex Hu et al. 2023)]MCJ1962114.1 flavodoxin family protein [Novosphingobium mangrovi (ex Hu et al. 2023)]